MRTRNKAVRWLLAALTAFVGILGLWLLLGDNDRSLEDTRRRQLELGVPGALCEGLRAIRLSLGPVMCTHGPDPAPEGVNLAVPQPLAGDPAAGGLPLPLPGADEPGQPSTAGGIAPGIACYGDGQSGNRVQAVYAAPADRPDRYDQVVGSIRRWAADTDAVVQSSAMKTGGTRRIRFVTDDSCELVVQRVRLSASGDDTFQNTLNEFQAQGLKRSDRKYLVWMDSNVLCGIASLYNDDRPSADNANNGRPGIPGSVSRIDNGCWGLGSRGESVEAHELMHSLGAVLPSAPNASSGGHCSDDSDRMCYQDGTVGTLRSVCPSSHEAIFDCGNDDYFHTSPRPASYLALRWNAANSSFLSSAPSEPSTAPPPPSNQQGQAQGYWVAAADGGIFTFGDAGFYGSTGSVRLNQPIVGMAATASGRGYWLVARDGGIFAFGDAGFYGSTGSVRLNQPIVGMAATPSGRGYWLVARDGGIFTFGDAAFLGSAGGVAGKRPIVGMAATPSGKGYWLVGSDGRIFRYGDAAPHGGPGAIGHPLVGIAATPTGGGYWLAGRDGTVYAFGDAARLGSAGSLNQPVAAIVALRRGHGFWLVASDGGIFSFGDAAFHGSTGNVRLNQPVVGMAGADR